MPAATPNTTTADRPLAAVADVETCTTREWIRIGRALRTLPAAADAFADLLKQGTGPAVTEIVLHVWGDGCTLDDGTPIPSTVVERIAPEAFLHYDHVPAYEQTHHTISTELQLRCAPCHRRRHAAA